MGWYAGKMVWQVEYYTVPMLSRVIVLQADRYAIVVGAEIRGIFNPRETLSNTRYIVRLS